MNVDMDAINRMRAVTISREYGSGGGEIAARLAQYLGWQLVDHEVVVEVAKALGVSEAEAQIHDERAEGLISRILTSMQLVEPVMLIGPGTLPEANEQKYRNALRDVVEAAVTQGHVVIVGRGAQMLLAQRRDILHARIVAPLDLRIAYVMRREGLNQNDARSRVQMKDRDRLRYLQAEYHQSPEDAHLYDLVVNTAVIDLDGAVDLIALALERKALKLGTPTGELGPGAGLRRYPGRPGDFRPPESISGSSQ
ncbi:MAG TPA: cytidylate kinase-like family protein [Ktedonobacteraceae bacterium]|jgi:cytidylate kinase|nr:cytidylate kinase-like family protein [Ktedonobacteraceae bacterium]